MKELTEPKHHRITYVRSERGFLASVYYKCLPVSESLFKELKEKPEKVVRFNDYSYFMFIERGLENIEDARSSGMVMFGDRISPECAKVMFHSPVNETTVLIRSELNFFFVPKWTEGGRLGPVGYYTSRDLLDKPYHPVAVAGAILPDEIFGYAPTPEGLSFLHRLKNSFEKTNII